LLREFLRLAHVTAYDPLVIPTISQRFIRPGWDIPLIHRMIALVRATMLPRAVEADGPNVDA
jgi:hypothetical protein